MRYVIGLLSGAGVGLAAWSFGRCTSGQCPLTGNVFVSVIIFSAIGVMLAARPAPEKGGKDTGKDPLPKN